ncbi:MAG: hypothetical protein AAGF85_21445 [Bacteroidota bacterium]
MNLQFNAWKFGFFIVLLLFLGTDDRKAVYAYRSKIRLDYKYKDVWVFSGVLDVIGDEVSEPVVEEEPVIEPDPEPVIVEEVKEPEIVEPDSEPEVE